MPSGFQRGAAALLPLALLAAAGSAGAQSAQGLTGDWGGYRDRLSDMGIDPTLQFVSESAYNATGGIKQGAREAGQFSLGATLDLQKLLNIDQAKAQFIVTDRFGRNLVGDEGIGALQQIQEVYGRGDIWRITELWYDQAFLDAADLKIGRMPVGDDFDTFPCDFENLSFCGAPAGNMEGQYWYNYPVAQWAARLKLQRPDLGYLQIGAYQQNTKNLEASQAFSLDYPSGTDGVLLPAEAAWTPKLGPDNLTGIYKLGLWYNSARQPDAVLDSRGGLQLLSGASALDRRGAYGAYLEFQQQVLHRAGASDSQGLSVFFNATEADRRTSTIDNQEALGLVFTGMFEDRPQDAIGLAEARTHVNSRIAAAEAIATAASVPNEPVQGAEYATELYYGFTVLPGLILRPNLQFIKDPGGTQANPDTFVLGLKAEVTF